MYEEVLKNMLVEKMNDHFSPFVSANRERKKFSTFTYSTSGRMEVAPG